MKTRDGIEVKVGQRWRNCDPRVQVRVKTIAATGSSVAGVEWVQWAERPRAKVCVRRMYKHARGWELVGVPSGATTKGAGA